MILHHYIWGDIDIDIVEEVAPHFLIAKHYGNLALFADSQNIRTITFAIPTSAFTPQVLTMKAKV